MASREAEYKPQPECPHCGEIHLGHSMTVHTSKRMKPCEICGEQTLYCCSDCQIERRETVHVCIKSGCRDAHEAKHPEHPKLPGDDVLVPGKIVGESYGDLRVQIEASEGPVVLSLERQTVQRIERKKAGK